MKIKKVINPFICLTMILMVCSCNNPLFLQRKYTKGRYFAHRTEVKSAEAKSQIAHKSITSTKFQAIQPQINTITDSVQNTQVLLENFSTSIADYDAKKPIQLLEPFGKQMQIDNAKLQKKNSHQYLSKESTFLKALGAWILSQLSALCLIPAIELIDVIGGGTVALSTAFLPAAFLILSFLLAFNAFKMAVSVLQGGSGLLSKVIAAYVLVNSISVIIVSIIILLIFIVFLIL
jgi:hypothetical protein